MKHALVLLLLPCLSGCIIRGERTEAPPNRLTAAEAAAGWKLLFDGETHRGWRGYRKDALPSGWQVRDGALVRTAQGGDIVTTEQFGSFDLVFEWRIAPDGNSGVFYRATEDTPAVWHNAPEYQVLDNARIGEGGDQRHSAGANYGLHAPRGDQTRQPGKWNEARISVHGNHVEHWLNGRKLLEYELDSPAWRELVGASKFAAHPEYGRAPRGHIAFQDHGDEVAYRNIKIRPLD